MLALAFFRAQPHSGWETLYSRDPETAMKNRITISALLLAAAALAEGLLPAR